MFQDNDHQHEEYIDKRKEWNDHIDLLIVLHPDEIELIKDDRETDDDQDRQK